jgi:hypothetical protein
MNAYWSRAVIGALLAWALFSPSKASARGLILVTYGDSIKHLGNAAPQGQPMAGVHQVGYKFGYFGVFWIDLWTYGGTYCVYQGKKYNPISRGEAARLLGKNESELGAPFLYTVPLGWLILGPLIVLWIVCALLTRGNQAHPVLNDPRYLKAVETVSEQYARQPAVVAAGPGAEGQAPTDEGTRFQVAFEAGVQQLTEAGIPREEAERNLAYCLQVLAQASAQSPPGTAQPGPTSAADAQKPPPQAAPPEQPTA